MNLSVEPGQGIPSGGIGDMIPSTFEFVDPVAAINAMDLLPLFEDEDTMFKTINSLDDDGYHIHTNVAEDCVVSLSSSASVESKETTKLPRTTKKNPITGTKNAGAKRAPPIPILPSGTVQTPTNKLASALANDIIRMKRSKRRSENSIPSYLPVEEQERLRRDRNRKHAQSSRLRKKVHSGTLQQTVDALKSQNEELRAWILSKDSVETVAGIQELVAQKRQLTTEKFISSLKAVQNRRLDTRTVRFLARLSKKVSVPCVCPQEDTDFLSSSQRRD